MCNSASLPSPVASTSQGRCDLLGFNKPCPLPDSALPLCPLLPCPFPPEPETREGPLDKYSLCLVGSGGKEVPLCWGQWRCSRGTAGPWGGPACRAAGSGGACPAVFLTVGWQRDHRAVEYWRKGAEALVIDCNDFPVSDWGLKSSELHCQTPPDVYLITTLTAFAFEPLSPWSLVFPGGASGKEPARKCRRHKRLGFNPLGGENALEEGMATHSSILPGESHGWRSLVG